MKDKEINSYYEPSIKTSRHDDIDDLKYTLHQEQKVNYSLIENIKRLHQENKQLKEKLDYDLQWSFKYEKQVDNWNELKKLLNQKYYNGERIDIKDILDKMQELEQGSD